MKKEKKKKEEVSQDRPKTKDIILDFKNRINKAYGDNVVMVGSDVSLKKVKTGVFSFDFETGGIARGRVFITVGEESTCKSTFMYTIAGRFQRVCGNCMSGTVKEIDYKKVTLKKFGAETEHYKLNKNGKIVSKIYLCDAQKKPLYSPNEAIKVLPLTAYTYSLECDVCANPEYANVVIVDSEQNYTREWASKFGIIHQHVILVIPEYSEQVGDVMREALNTGRVSLVVIDSLDAQPPQIEDESSFSDQQMGVQARVWNKITRSIHSKLNKRFTYEFKDKEGNIVTEVRRAEFSVGIVQQWRLKIGISYGDPRTMGGGKGKNYASSLTIDMSKGDKDWKSKEDRLLNGIFFNFSLLKQKTGTPYRNGRFYFDVNKGMICNEATILDYAVKYGVVQQAGAWFEFDGERYQGKQKLIAVIEKDKNVRKKMMGLIMAERME